MLYAKSEPEESIKEHTQGLLDRLEILQKNYGKQILENKGIEEKKFWELLHLACIYHDIGKVYTPFQNMLKKKLKKSETKTEFSNTIKHEKLSPLFIPKEQIIELNKEEKRALMQSIYYHHEREDISLDKNLVNEIIQKDIKPRTEELEKELGIPLNHMPNNTYLGYVGNDKRIKQRDTIYKEYCLLKGLVHRLDHSASAHVQIEDITDEKIGDHIERVMQEKEFIKNELQKYCQENQDENMVIIGSTGMGKTEAGLLWSNGDKTFFTLPIRISINAIYDRISEEYRYQPYVGLLHSSSLDYIESKSGEGDEDNEIQNEEARNLSKKITTCTIDQIFTFVFKYAGYEKMYATLAYSKVIIDEIQAYSPEIVAVILKGLEMIHKMGGKFLIMTATLPRIYKEKLIEMGIPFKNEQFLSTIKRHKIKICPKEILEDIDEIIEKSKDKKVLIIVNTVDRAIQMYDEIKEKTDNVYALHSRFIKKDREEKERKIKSFAEEKESYGIWITTQIVEASIDIDFDHLYTEMSALDSLFQRLGRCYRKREWTKEECNVHIYTQNVSGIGGIYDKDIYEKSIDLLKDYNEKVLLEEEKVKMVDNLYSKESLKETDFLRKFEEGSKILNDLTDYRTSKKEAQKILRNIENVDVIPKQIYDKNIKLFENYKAEENKEKRRKLRKEIEKLTTSITKGQARAVADKLFEIEFEGAKGIDAKYSEEIGLILKQSIDDDLESRNL